MGLATGGLPRPRQGVNHVNPQGRFLAIILGNRKIELVGKEMPVSVYIWTGPYGPTKKVYPDRPATEFEYV